MASTAPPPPLHTLAGPHTDSVICLASNELNPNTLASGGEDGRLVLHDLRAAAADAGAAASASTPSSLSAVAALCFDPCRPGVLLYAAAGTQVVALDLRKLVSSSGTSWAPVAASSPADAARDDVSALAAGGGLLAAADDSGDVAVFDLAAGEQPGAALKRRVLLRRVHGDSPACAVAFAASSPAPAVLSGGCDSRVVLTDTGLPPPGSSGAAKRRVPRPLSAWQMGGEEPGGAGGGGEGGGGGDGDDDNAAAGTTTNTTTVGAGTVGGPRVCNPPFVFGLATTTTIAAAGGSGRLVAAAARGDGVVAIFEPTAGAASSSRSAPPSSTLIEAHRRAASCARFFPPGADASSSSSPLPPLATGGDDGRVCLWRWPSGSSLGQPAVLAWEATMPKRAKVNALCVVGGGGGGEEGAAPLLAVADTSRRVKLFPTR